MSAWFGDAPAPLLEEAVKIAVDFLDRTGEIEFRIVEGSSERIQLEALLAYLVLVGGPKK